MDQLEPVNGIEFASIVYAPLVIMTDGLGVAFYAMAIVMAAVYWFIKSSLKNVV